MAEIDVYEIRRSEWRDEDAMWGERTFSIPKASVNTLSNDYALGTLWPGDVNLGDRRLVHWDLDRDFPDKSGLSRMVCRYKTPTWDEQLSLPLPPGGQPDGSGGDDGPDPGGGTGTFPASIAGKGRLIVEIGAQREEVTHDLDGKVIIGPVAAGDAPDVDNVYLWKVTRGTNIVLIPYCNAIIDAAINDLRGNAATYMGLVNKYNNAQCAKIGNATAKTLLFLGMELIRTLHADPYNQLEQVQFKFKYNPQGWDSQLKSGIFKQYLRRQEVLKVDGDASGQFRVVRAESYVADSSENRRTNLGGADFGLFNDMLDWAI